jgi:hypothetical protein
MQARFFRRDAALAITTFFIVGFGALSVQIGQDANWDLKNYHLYTAFELLHGRLWLDLNAGGYQGLFNPLMDLPYYFLSLSLFPDYPRVVAFVMGLNSALLALAVTSIVFIVFRREARDISWIAIAAAIYIGLSGGLSISELGTTFNDVFPAALVLCGVAIVLLDFDRTVSGLRHQYLAIAFGGVLFGVAAGLKLSAALFAPAFVLALPLAKGLSRRTLVAMTLFCLGWGLGWGGVSGFWTYQVFSLTGNPVLPMFNQIFRSDWYPPVGYFDERWRTHGFLQTVAFPFFWASSGHSVITEVVFGDARFAAAYTAIVILAAGIGARYLTRSRIAQLSSRKFSGEAQFVVWFIVLSYVFWQLVFCIGRYMVGIEVLLGIPILLAVWKLASLIAAASVRRVLIDVAMVFTALALQAGTQYPDWGRVPYGDTVLAVQAPRLPPNSLVVISGSPNGYIVPFLRGQEVRFVGVNHLTMEARGYGLWNDAARRIARHDGEIFVLERADGSSPRFTLEELRLFVDESRCVGILTNLDKDIRLCVAHR